MATASLISWLRFAGARAVDGTPVASGLAYFWRKGSTSVAITVYADDAAATPLAQPVTLDAAGRATVYAIEQSEIVITTAAGAAVSLATCGNTVEAEQVNCSWGGEDAALDEALDSIAGSLTAAYTGSHTEVTAGGATPSFEFDPTADVNAFICSYAGAVTGISVTWPGVAPTIPVGKRFTIVFQFPSGTTYSGSISWVGGNIIEASETGTKLTASSADRMWTADFVCSLAGALVQATPWLATQGDRWVAP